MISSQMSSRSSFGSLTKGVKVSRSWRHCGKRQSSGSGSSARKAFVFIFGSDLELGASVVLFVKDETSLEGELRVFLTSWASSLK